MRGLLVDKRPHTPLREVGGSSRTLDWGAGKAPQEDSDLPR